LSEFVYHAEILASQRTEDSVTLQLHVPQHLYYFQGHFTDAPVLPGVVLTHWVMENLNEHFSADLDKFQGFKGLKFQIIVRPNYQLKLVLNKLSDGKFSFSYNSDHGQHASGKVLFE
jgi:3-hydroxymyristoyl/3-hydroxydecanoyl-(acyl carrier protein) dehydratase